MKNRKRDAKESDRVEQFSSNFRTSEPLEKTASQRMSIDRLPEELPSTETIGLTSRSDMLCILSGVEESMVFEKLLPRKFSSRLFLMTFVAGLIPIVIFTLLINTYGKRIEHEMRRIIEEGYRHDVIRSEAMLREMGEASVYSRVLETAQQLDLVVESVPWMTLSDLRRDAKFRELAVQSISQTGYTYLFEADTAIVRFHRDRRLENKDLRRLFRNMPEFQNILRSALQGPRPSRGYYRLKAGDGNIMERYICIAPLRNVTSDGIRLMLAATVNAEDFSARIRESQEIHDTTKRFLTLASKRSIESFRQWGLLFMGIGILTVSLLAFVMGIYSSRAVTRRGKPPHGSMVATCRRRSRSPARGKWPP